MSRWIMCDDCECDRPRLVLTEDPPRREGMASYSYFRLIWLGLSDANEAWMKRTGETLVLLDHPPYLKVQRQAAGPYNTAEKVGQHAIQLRASDRWRTEKGGFWCTRSSG